MICPLTTTVLVAASEKFSLRKWLVNVSWGLHLMLMMKTQLVTENGEEFERGWREERDEEPQVDLLLLQFPSSTLRIQVQANFSWWREWIHTDSLQRNQRSQFFCKTRHSPSCDSRESIGSWFCPTSLFQIRVLWRTLPPEMQSLMRGRP